MRFEIQDASEFRPGTYQGHPWPCTKANGPQTLISKALCVASARFELIDTEQNMGKPTPSFHNVSIGTIIAQLACKATDNKLDLVARSGHYSVYQAVKDIYPQCIRDDQTNRDGVSECQLNKALQKAGFKRVRDRRAHVSKRSNDPTGAGMYLFSSLRWRDSNNKEDRQEMIDGWNSIIERFPKIAQHCTLGRFLDTVAHFRVQWQPSADRINNASNSEVEASDDESDENSASQRTPVPEPAPLPALGNPIPPNQLNQEIMRLKLELAAAQTLSLIQAQSASASMLRLPPASIPMQKLAPNPGFAFQGNSLLGSTVPSTICSGISPSITDLLQPSALAGSNALSLLLSQTKSTQNLAANPLHLTCPTVHLNLVPPACK